MNEVIKNMEERRSVRGYKPDMIRKEDLIRSLRPELMRQRNGNAVTDHRGSDG